MAVDYGVIYETFGRARSITFDVVIKSFEFLAEDFPGTAVQFDGLDFEGNREQIVRIAHVLIETLENPADLSLYLQAIKKQDFMVGLNPRDFECIANSFSKSLQYFFGDDWTKDWEQNWSEVFTLFSTLMARDSETIFSADKNSKGRNLPPPPNPFGSSEFECVDVKPKVEGAKESSNKNEEVKPMATIGIRGSEIEGKDEVSETCEESLSCVESTDLAIANGIHDRSRENLSDDAAGHGKKTSRGSESKKKKQTSVTDPKIKKIRNSGNIELLTVSNKGNIMSTNSSEKKLGNGLVSNFENQILPDILISNIQETVNNLIQTEIQNQFNIALNQAIVQYREKGLDSIDLTERFKRSSGKLGEKLLLKTKGKLIKVKATEPKSQIKPAVKSNLSTAAGKPAALKILKKERKPESNKFENMANSSTTNIVEEIKPAS